jgi:hypothetical protein
MILNQDLYVIFYVYIWKFKDILRIIKFCGLSKSQKTIRGIFQLKKFYDLKIILNIKE